MNEHAINLNITAYCHDDALFGRLFAKAPLIPAIAQDCVSGQVLMLAYMSEESLRRTLQSGTAWYFSRSRGEFWNKGATSGHWQHVREIFFDCDADTLLLLVEQDGAACHTGQRSCFFNKIDLERETDGGE